MTKKHSLKGIVLATVIVMVAVGAGLFLHAGQAKPNIVVIVADDLGWADVGYHNDRSITPNIDALAAEGIELDRFYTAPSCTPTRAGLLTGRYPIRFGMARSALPPYRDFGLPAEELTLPEVLSTHGYAERGAFGKWHLGHLDPKWHPLAHGFTHFEGHYNGAIDYYSHSFKGERDWHVNYEPKQRTGYSTDLIAAAAEKFIEKSIRSSAPYFAWVAFNAPHAPFQAKPEDARELGFDPDNLSKEQSLAAMVLGLDRAVGKILRAIDRTGEKRDTIVWFLSDNGGEPGLRGGNPPLNGHKLNTFEGGIRVPAAVRWPRTWLGGRKTDITMGYIDLLPTLLAVASNGQHELENLDGTDLSALFDGSATHLAKRDWYSYLGQNGPSKEWLAIASGGWKLIVYGPRLNNRGLTSEHLVALYDIEADPNESNDMTQQFPRRIELLARKLQKYRALQPDHSLPPYMEGARDPFTPPLNWRNSPVDQ